MTRTATEFLAEYGGPPAPARDRRFIVVVADGEHLDAHRALRRRTFVDEQRLFSGTDRDDLDDAPGTVVLVAIADGVVVAGVRIGPVCEPDIGWWAGSRLVATPGAPHGVGRALIRAACAHAEAGGALRFDAVVQADKERLFRRLGWEAVGAVVAFGAPHVAMRWPIGRMAVQTASKRPIASVLAGLRPGGDGFVGDDGAPIPGTDLVAVCDAILPAMVERDPWWAGWCSVLVNANDLAAMGARPVGLLDAVGAPTSSLATRVMAGLAEAADRWGVPVLGGHTQTGVQPSLAVTMLGRTDRPVPGGGGNPGDELHVLVDLGGSWRSGHTGRQWDSTTRRSSIELRTMHDAVAALRPAAAKDISMAGLVGTAAMLAEASDCAAVIDVAAVPRPETSAVGDWLTCFPGFGMVLAGSVQPGVQTGPAMLATCGSLTEGTGVSLRWPDGMVTAAVSEPVVGLGPASKPSTGGQS